MAGSNEDAGKDAMHIGPLVSRSIVEVGPDHSLIEVARRMTHRKVGSAIVHTDEGAGIITERDVLRAVAEGADLERTPVSAYMTANAITATSSWDVAEAARRMSEGGFRHLVVVDDSGRASGILSMRDLVDAVLARLTGA